MFIYIVMFPVEYLAWKINNLSGYDLETNVWTIYNQEYSSLFFLHFAIGDDRLFKIIKNEHGHVTIGQPYPPQDKVIELKEKNRDLWLDKPETFWLGQLTGITTTMTLKQIGSMPVDKNNLTEIAALCLNWLDNIQENRFSKNH